VTGTPAPWGRRQLLGTAIGGSIVGGLWGAGLATLARGRQPTVFVLGNEGWQLVLVDDAGSRALLLIGKFERSLGDDIDRILSVFRQRIDIVAGSTRALDTLPPGFFSRRRVRHVALLPDTESESAVDTPPTAGHDREYRFGAFRLAFGGATEGAWMGNAPNPAVWLAILSAQGCTVAIAPDTAILARHAPTNAVLAIAPTGDPVEVWAALPGVAVAINGSVIEHIASRAAADDDRDHLLVRTFPQDIASFAFQDGRISLPEWAVSAVAGSPA